MVYTSAAAAAACLAFSHAAQALPDPREPEAMIVTGTRFESTSERLPVRVSTIDRAQLDERVLLTLPEALLGLPGVSVVQSGPAGSLTSVFIRGSNSKHALVVLDGIRLNDPSTATGVYNFGSALIGDAQRIELVRGPLSSVYGSNAVGGVINLIPALPDDAGRSWSTSLAAGSLNTVHTQARGGLATERLRLAVTAEALTSDGYDAVPARMNTADGDADGTRLAALTLVGDYQLDPAWGVEALLRVSAARTDFDSFSGGPSGVQRADGAGLNNRDDALVGRAGVIFQRGSMTSRLRAGVVSSALESRDGPLIADQYEAERQFAEWLTEWVVGDAGALTDLDVSAGLQLERDDITVDTAFNDPLQVAETSRGAFLVGQAGLGPRIDLTASARLDDYDAFGSVLTASLGAVWVLPGDQTRITGSLGSAFNAPTLSERFASSPFVTPNPELEAEESVNWELGFDTALPAFGQADGLRLGASRFSARIENLIENVFDFTSFTGKNQNVGEAEIDGYEAFILVVPTETIELRLDYTQTDAINAVTGARLLRRAPHRWTASLRWAPQPDRSVSIDYVWVGARRDVTYDDAGFFGTVGGVISAYELVNLSAQARLNDRLEIYGALKNLLDETYEEPAAFAGAPRRLMLGVRVRG